MFIKASRFVFLLFTFYFLLVTSSIAPADTIRTTDGKELKGIVVEEYNDRLVFSTADGEMPVLKSDIRELLYDSKEDNLIRLAEAAREHRDYTKAFVYYDMAVRLNPDSKAAKDGLIFLQGYLFRQEQAKKEEAIKKREEIEQFGTTVAVQKSDEDKSRDSVDDLKNNLGLTLEMKNQEAFAKYVTEGSPAYEAGVRSGDKVVAVWSKLTGYLTLAEIVEMIMEKSALEIKMTVEKNVDVRINRSRGTFSSSAEGLIGATLAIEFEGVTVTDVKPDSYASKAGLNKGDVITRINGKPTRYMNLKKVVSAIRKNVSDFVKLTIRRAVIMWRRA